MCVWQFFFIQKHDKEAWTEGEREEEKEKKERDREWGKDQYHIRIIFRWHKDKEHIFFPLFINAVVEMVNRLFRGHVYQIGYK